MTKRGMTVKGFVKKATSTSLTALGFLEQHREYLTTGEVASIASPILVKIDDGSLEAEVGLENITNAVFAHMLNLSVLKAEEKIAQKEDRTPAADKNHLTRLLSSTGMELKSESFIMGQDAQRAGERWLLNSEAGSYVQVETLKLKTRGGQPFITLITRDDAFANQYRHKPGPVMKGKPVSTSKLGFGVKAKQDHCHFSRG